MKREVLQRQEKLEVQAVNVKERSDKLMPVHRIFHFLFFPPGHFPYPPLKQVHNPIGEIYVLIGCKWLKENMLCMSSPFNVELYTRKIKLNILP